MGLYRFFLKAKFQESEIITTAKKWFKKFDGKCK